MKLVVGLGNPGPSYARTRHNVGFRVVDGFAEKHGIRLDERRFRGRTGRGVVAGERVTLLQPQTFMNVSGESVGRARRALRLDPPDILVVYDEVDLPPGKIRVRADGGAGGHRGVLSIVEAVGGRNFPRIRVGVGRPGGAKVSPDYVIARPTPEEAEILGDAIERSVEAIGVWLGAGVQEAMNQFNG